MDNKDAEIVRLKLIINDLSGQLMSAHNAIKILNEYIKQLEKKDMPSPKIDYDGEGWGDAATNDY